MYGLGRYLSFAAINALTSAVDPFAIEAPRRSRSARRGRIFHYTRPQSEESKQFYLDRAKAKRERKAAIIARLADAGALQRGTV